MKELVLLKLALRTLIAIAKAILRIINNNDAAVQGCDPAEDEDPDLPDSFTK